jgi:hypothetical protein
MDGVVAMLSAFQNALCAMVCFAGMQNAAFASAPLLQYKTTAGPDNRKLIFVNNPEILHAERGMCDIGDTISVRGTPCGRSLFRVDNAIGVYRNWFEHINRTGAPLRYAVRVRNEGSACARVTVSGSGFSRNAVSEGGREFVGLFSGAAPFVYNVCPGEHRFLMAIDGANAVARWKFFTGVVDFQIEGEPLVVENVAFHHAPAEVLEPLGYTTRTDFTAHESLVYKGVSEHSQAVADNVNFVLDEATPVGRLKVRYATYAMPVSSGEGSEGRCLPSTFPRCTGETGSFKAVEERDHWVTHIAPNPEDANPKRANAVVSDLVTLITPGLPEGCLVPSAIAVESCFLMSPFYKWYYPDFEKWKYPNWGNWAVQYILKGTLTNKGSRARTVHFGIRADGNSPIAYKGHNTPWKYFPLVKASNNNPNDYFPYATIEVPVGATLPYQVEYVLSGPAAGTLQNLVKVVN